MSSNHAVMVRAMTTLPWKTLTSRVPCKAATDPPGPGMQKFEERFAKWVVAVPRRIVVVSLILTALAGGGSAFLEFSVDFRIFFTRDNPQLLALETLENTYGKSDNILFMIVPDDGDAASQQALEASVWLTEQAWQTPLSSRVDSIANFQHTRADGDNLIVSDLVDPQKLDDPQERRRIRAILLADPRLAGSLFASDGSVSAVNVTLEVPREQQTVMVPRIAAFARDLAAETQERFPGIEVRPAGMAMIGAAFAEASVQSQMIFLPASLVVMAVILFLLTRRLAGVVATGLVMVLAVAASTGLGGWVGLPFTPSTAPAPTIVLMMVVANCVHLLVAMRQRMQAGDAKRDAIIHAVRINLYPVFLASTTTVLGFLSLNFSEVPPYRHLGNFVAFGIAASFLLTVTFLPALLSLLPMRETAGARSDGDPAMAAVAEFVVRRRKLLLWSSASIVLALAAALPRNDLNDVLVHFFDESVELRQNMDLLDARLGGNTILEYSLVSTGPGDAVDPAFLADVSAFAQWCRQQPEIRHVMTIADTFRSINMSMHGDDPEAYRLPERRDLAAQYLLLYELSLPQGLGLNTRIDAERSATRVTVSAKTLPSRETVALNARLETWLEANAPHIVQADGTGSALIFAHLGQRNIRAMLGGTAFALLGISIILIVAFRSLRIGLISLVPNFVPALLAFGVWGLAVGQIGVSLSVVVAMTIGIVVDDTVHFLSKYLRARRERGESPEAAVRYAFATAGRALFTTTTVLVAGFLILPLSPFVPTAEVGIVTALIIAFAMLADFALLPPILMALDRKAATKATR